ncbi:MAG: 50S ribosomal protein L25, partial [Sphingobacteriia bacterium]
MKTIQLKAQKREEIGKSSVKKVRGAGMTPAVIYTPEGPHHIKVETKEVIKVLFTPDTYLIHLDVAGKTFTTIVKHASFHPLHDNVLDVEFQLVHADRPIQVKLPVQLKGNSPGVLAGGRLVQKSRKLKVRGMAQHLPELLTVDISELRLGHSLKVRDLKYDTF